MTAQLFAWGMMAVSLLEMLKAVEARFGREGQQTCTDALVEVGRRLALEGLDGVGVPEGISPIEAIPALPPGSTSSSTPPLKSRASTAPTPAPSTSSGAPTRMCTGPSTAASSATLSKA
jgi:hypothetical protein